VLERLSRLIKRHEEDGPREDLGPMIRPVGGAPSHLPSRDFIGAEPADLAPDPNAEAERWEHERELYKQKNDGPPAGD